MVNRKSIHAIKLRVCLTGGRFDSTYSLILPRILIESKRLFSVALRSGFAVGETHVSYSIRSGPRRKCQHIFQWKLN